MTAPAVEIAGDLATIVFDRYDLASYELFVGTKRLPESQITYDIDADAYTLTTPARFAPLLGVAVPQRDGASMPIADHLFDYQRWALGMALDAKRFALWMDTGTGKTAVYLEWARHVQARTGGRVLIFAPLAIIPQVLDEYDRFYPPVPDQAKRITHLRTRDEVVSWCRTGWATAKWSPDSQLLAITNYEKLDAGDIPEFRYLAGIVCDEASVLKTGAGTRKWGMIHSSKGVEYKLACTATPAPNEVMEYASQAAFLEKLRSEGEILWTWFTRNQRGVWSIKPHAKGAFYAFMASWSLYLRDPARFGFADILATLPPPVVIEERIPMTAAQREILAETAVKHGAGLWADEGLGITARTKLAQAARGFLYEGKAKTVRRVDSLKPGWVASIAAEEAGRGERVLIWTAFDAEGAIVREELDAAGIACADVAVLDGKMAPEARLETLARFRSGELRILISKPQLIGYGLNLQFVKRMVFSGFDDSFERSYQAIRRCYRFGQTETVKVWFPYVPELEGIVFDNIRQKEARFLSEVAAQEDAYRVALAGSLTAGEGA